METEMREHLGRNWGWLVLRGVAAVLFGALALTRPAITLAALVFMWGAYAMADGVLAMIAGWRIREGGRPLWSLFFTGALGIAAGVATYRWPGLTALVLLIVIASWAIGVGLLQVVAAIRLRKVIEGEWALGLSGVLSVAFGVLAALHPGAGALAVLWMIGGYAIAFGVLLIAVGIQVQAAGHQRLAPA
ncbi:MAG: HdeD family acid-resistance protein [Pseudomonadota bacterium]